MTRHSTTTILLVEDNVGDARLLREMFNEPGSHNTKLTHVECMSEAEQILAARTFDIILLDLGLPDAQGLAAVRRAQSAAPLVPIVVLTGMDDESLAVEALQEGAQDYLVKGQIETRGLLRALRYAIERKRLEEALLEKAKAESQRAIDDMKRITVERQRAEAEGRIRSDLEQRDIARTAELVAIKESDLRLRESERRFQDIAEVSGDWIWETDREHRFTLLSGQRTDGLATRPESLIGRTRWETAGANLASDQLWTHHRADLDAHEAFRHFRYEIRTGAGVDMFISASGKPVFDQDNNFIGYRGTATDETLTVVAQRRAEAAELQLQDAIHVLNRRIFETSLDLILVTDGYGLLIRVSPSATAILGYDPYEMVGRSAAEFIFPEDLEITREEMRIARRVEKTQSFECRYIHKNGPIVSLWWTGVWSNSGKQYFFIGRDITDRKENERHLRESEEQLKRAQQLAHMGSDIRNLQTDEAEWSDETYRIFGVSRGTYVPSTANFMKIVHPEDRASVLATRKQIKQGVCPEPFEYRITRPDGSMRYIRRENELIRDEKGVPLYLAGTIHDVTEYRHTEQQLRQAQKMEAIGNLTGGMAHDFNNLLGIIIGNLDLAQERIGDDTELREFTGEALEAALRGADLTRRLLAFARRQPLCPALTDVNELATDTVRLLRRLLGEAIEISLNLGDGVWPVLVDPAQLQASLANLANNARDAMPDGGRLIIATANRHLDAEYVAAYPEATEGDFVLIEVTDTGGGMSPEIISQIFEPFFTTKEPGKGTGLGLSMVFGFLRQSGGNVSVYSEPGVGTTFRLYLPRSVAASAQIDVPDPISFAHGAGETVLVVEDNSAMRQVALRQLRGLGYRVLECDRATAALDTLQREPVDLLFTDVIMPGEFDGIELARRAQERWPALKIILTSGFPEARIDENGSVLRSLRLLSKPYRKEELAATVRAALDG